MWGGLLITFLLCERGILLQPVLYSIVGLRERHRALIIDRFGRVAGNGLRVLEALYRRPFITVNGIVDLTGVSFTAASQLTNKFLQIGLLHEVTGQA